MGSVVAAVILVTAVLMTIARLLLHIWRTNRVATTVQNEPSRPSVRPNDYEIPVRPSSPAQLQQPSPSEQQKTLFDQPPAYSTIAEYSTVEPPPPYPGVKNTIPPNTAHANI